MNREEIYNAFIEKMNSAFVFFEIVPIDEKKYDFVFIDVNQAFEDYFNINRNDLIYKHLSSFSNVFSPNVFQFFNKIINLNIPSVFEITSTDGNHFYEITAYPFDNKFIALQINDITKRKKLEKAFIDSEEKYRILADKSPISIIVIDKFGKINFANDYFFANFLKNLYKKEEILGKELSSLSFCDTVTCKEIKNVLQNHIVELKEINIKINSKIEYYCNVRAVPLVCKDEIKGGIIIIENITERKIAELKLFEQNLLQQLLLDNVDLMIWYMQTPTKIKLYNHSFAGFFGLDDKSQDIYLEDFLPKYEVEDLKDIFTKVWKIKYPQYFDKFIFNKLGNKRLLKIKVTPKVNFESNEVEFLVCSATDITEQRRNEEEMKNLIIALKLSNRLTDERATEIMELNRQLQASQERLKASIAAKDKFFSIIAHDLVSPFQGFMSLTKYLNQKIHELSTNEVKELALALNKSASNLHKLIENLLNWSRIQRGKITYMPEFVDLQKIVQMNIELAYETANAKKIKLINAVETPIKVYSDLNLLNTILRNLISNAIKFTNYDGEVIIGYNQLDNNFIELFVKDNGIGMDEATLDGLFKIDNFNSSLGTANETGTGLGLVLCKEFAQINKGSIRVESKLGEGSIFYLKLPTIILEN